MGGPRNRSRRFGWLADWLVEEESVDKVYATGKSCKVCMDYGVGGVKW